MFATLQRILDRALTRVLLSIAIVVSLVPHHWMLDNDAWFLAIFGPEVIARGLLAFRRESLPVPPGRRLRVGWRAPSAGELVLLLLDLVAVISFLPAVAGTFLNARWLRLFRLSRTLLLLRYWAPVVNDLWEVTRRPERRRQLVFIFGSMIVICFAGAVLLDHVATDIGDDFDGDGVIGDEHDHEFFVRMWWAFRQIEDPGNLLASPHDSGTLVVSVALTLAGLFVISFIIGIGTDVVGDLSEIGRSRSPGLARHTVIVNANSSARRLLRELLHEEFKLLPAATDVVGLRWLAKLWRNLRTSRAFVVVGRQAERPDFLREPEFSRVVYRAWEDGDDDTLMLRGDVLMARRIVLLADDGDTEPDDDTVRSSLSIVEQMMECEDGRPRRLIAEIVSLDNLPAAQRATQRAAEPLSTSVIPTEALIARSLAAVCRTRGLAALMTELLRSEGHEVYAWEPEGDDSRTHLGSCAGPHPLEALAQAGDRPGIKRVVPLGLVLEGGGAEASLNPGGAPQRGVRGVIAVADTGARLSDLVAARGNDTPCSPNGRLSISLEAEASLSMRRILVCGFRPATVQLVEGLLAHAEPGAELMLLVTDQAARARATEFMRAQGAMVRQGLAQERGGSFVVSEQGALGWQPSAGGEPFELRVEIADWTSPRSLGELPQQMGSAADFDLVLFSSNGSGESDARNTTGLMTMEALVDASGQQRSPRLVAEVDDVELAARLNARYRDMHREEVHVFSTDELRALIVFQSVIVPRFSTLLVDMIAAHPGSTDASLVATRAQLPDGSQSVVAFSELAESLRAQGRVLVAVDQRMGLGVQVGGVDQVDLKSTRLWVLERGTTPPESGEQAGSKPA